METKKNPYAGTQTEKNLEAAFAGESMAWIFVTAGSLPGAGLRTFYALLVFSYMFFHRDTGRSDTKKCLIFPMFLAFRGDMWRSVKPGDHP